MFLLSLAFLVTGGFLMLHAIGTPDVLFSSDLLGFRIVIPVGLLAAALFAGASAFVDSRPGGAEFVERHRRGLRRSVLAAMAIWVVLTLLELPPVSNARSEGSGPVLRTLAAVGAAVYAISAVRYAIVYRRRLTLLPASIIGCFVLRASCFVLLAEAMLGNALLGERTWPAS